MARRKRLKEFTDRVAATEVPFYERDIDQIRLVDSRVLDPGCVEILLPDRITKVWVDSDTIQEIQRIREFFAEPFSIDEGQWIDFLTLEGREDETELCVWAATVYAHFAKYEQDCFRRHSIFVILKTCVEHTERDFKDNLVPTGLSHEETMEIADAFYDAVLHI